MKSKHLGWTVMIAYGLGLSGWVFDVTVPFMYKLFIVAYHAPAAILACRAINADKIKVEVING
jgi:hypothetical protein